MLLRIEDDGDQENPWYTRNSISSSPGSCVSIDNLKPEDPFLELLL